MGENLITLAYFIDGYMATRGQDHGPRWEARKAPAQHVDGFHFGPVHLCDVAEVRDIGPAVREYLAGGWFGFAVPRNLPAEHFLDCHVEAAASAEQ